MQASSPGYMEQKKTFYWQVSRTAVRGWGDEEDNRQLTCPPVSWGGGSDIYHLNVFILSWRDMKPSVRGHLDVLTHKLNISVE